MATISAHRPLSPTIRLDSVRDERLARRVGEADEDAFTELYERHHQALYRYCRAILRDDIDAQDALQSTWTRALVALRNGRRDAPLRPWLYRIAHNESVSVLRRRARPADPVGHVPPPEASAEQQVLERERFSMLIADLRALSERPRGALVLRELNGLSHEEIASALDTSVAGAKQSIYEARRELADFAAGRELACEEICRRMSDGDGRVLRGRRIRAHLRSCRSCAAFAEAMGMRRSALPGLIPVLPAAASAALLRRVLAGGIRRKGVGGSGGAAGAGATTISLAGKSAGVALLTKAAAGMAVVGASVAVATQTFSAGPSASPAGSTRLAAAAGGWVPALSASLGGHASAPTGISSRFGVTVQRVAAGTERGPARAIGATSHPVHPSQSHARWTRTAATSGASRAADVHALHAAGAPRDKGATPRPAQAQAHSWGRAGSSGKPRPPATTRSRAARGRPGTTGAGPAATTGAGSAATTGAGPAATAAPAATTGPARPATSQRPTGSGAVTQPVAPATSPRAEVPN